MMLYDIQTFLCSVLDRNDRMTMASSIECRVPFLAVRLTEAALKLPVRSLFVGRRGKMVLRDHAADLLPREIRFRAKWGLGIPWMHYFRSEPSCREYLSNLASTELARALDIPLLPTAVQEFLAGDDRKFSIVYEVFSLAVWWQEIVDAGSRQHPMAQKAPQRPAARSPGGRRDE